MVYRWKEAGISWPFSSYSPEGRPNICRVLSFGVAVKAKKLMFCGRPVAATSAARMDSVSASPPSSRSACSSGVSTRLSLAAAEPVWEECASSAITA